MNSALLIIIILLWFFLGYKIYGRFIEKQIKPNDKNKTPALTNKNKIDFSPANKPFLIGHHFESIAGAGPIIGPILAISYFGWLAVVLWISIGSVFIGAMHDYVTLMASVKNKAKGVSNIAKDFLGSKSGWVFGAIIWITLILIITVFSVSTAESIIYKPELIIPLIAISVIALVLGFGVERFKWNYKISSIIAIILVFAFIWIGNKYPISIGIENPILLRNIWISIIILYAGIASVAPIWLLLRPRDYLSSIQLFILMALGFIGILIVRPEISAPIYISGNFPLWPILFITVACGAVSGFHGIVSSGITSKQLAKESHGKSVGYGAMLGEASLAILVTVLVISGLKWGSEISGGFQETLKEGWVALFSSGYGNIVGSIGIPLITISFAALLGTIMVNQFILTTVDTSTRLGRLVISENLFPKFKNRFLTTILTLIPAWLLAITNSYETLWKLFGSSNQLIASISLIAVSCFFISRKRNVKFILIPAVFVLLTTLSALIYLIFRTNGYLAQGNFVLTSISLIMVTFGIFVSFEGFKFIMKKSKSLNQD
ncbi:MAG: carbon starvation CstA family protein [Nanoarchaeota archaeon]